MSKKICERFVLFKVKRNPNEQCGVFLFRVLKTNGKESEFAIKTACPQRRAERKIWNNGDGCLCGTAERTSGAK